MNLTQMHSTHPPPPPQCLQSLSPADPGDLLRLLLWRLLTGSSNPRLITQIHIVFHLTRQPVKLLLPMARGADQLFASLQLLPPAAAAELGARWRDFGLFCSGGESQEKEEQEQGKAQGVAEPRGPHFIPAKWGGKGRFMYTRRGGGGVLRKDGLVFLQNRGRNVIYSVNCGGPGERGGWCISF
jgi:hypothetical protein